MRFKPLERSPLNPRQHSATPLQRQRVLRTQLRAPAPRHRLRQPQRLHVRAAPVLPRPRAPARAPTAPGRLPTKPHYLPPVPPLLPSPTVPCPRRARARPPHNRGVPRGRARRTREGAELDGRHAIADS